MDALPIKEETTLEYACENGNMHACGHDAHTAMLIAAAKMLKEKESELKCTVKLLFQAAEETLEGAKNAIENGILDNPKVDAATMLHVVVGTEFESGSVIVSSAGVSAPAVEYFRIKIKGKGAHGSTPEKSKDALALACRITLALEEIKAKELGLNEKAVITIGSLMAGKSANVIPDTATVQGSARAFRQDTMEYINQRIENISTFYAQAYGLEAKLEFYSGAPALENEGKMSEFALKCAENTLGGDKTLTSEKISALSEKSGQKSVGAGSEDFAYIAREVPSVMIALCAGKASQGYTYPLHHPKFRLDESSLEYGSKLFYAIATNYN
jgi:hippurate hydrolase